MKSLKKIGIISAIIVIVGVLSTLSQVFAVDYNEELANCDMEIGKLEDILATCNEKQNQAHNMAEAARALEFAEDDVVIQKAQEVWYDAEESKQNLTVSLDELYAHRVDLEAKVEKAKEEAQREADSREYVGTFKLTAYCPCYSCSEGYGRSTASGATATEGVTVAADTRVLPLGTRIYIEGVGERVVQDVGGAIKSNKIDVFVDNHSSCYNDAYNQSAAKVWILH